MSREERYGERDLTYSGWHRTIDDKEHPLGPLDYIDLDAIEYCHDCKKPLALIELAKDIGQSHKTTTVTRRLAKMAGVPAYLVYYRINENQTIDRFRLKQVSPSWGKEQVLAPDEYVDFLFGLREEHNKKKEAERKAREKHWEEVYKKIKEHNGVQ